MSIYDIVIVAIFGIAAILLLIARTNVALAILALCAGFMFNSLIAEDIVGYLYRNEYSRGSIPIASLVSIILILLPSLLVIFRFRHRQKSRWLQHLIPIFAYLILVFLFILQNLPVSTEVNLIENSQVGRFLNDYDIFIAIGVVGVALLDVLIFDGERNRQFNKLKKRQKKKHK